MIHPFTLIYNVHFNSTKPSTNCEKPEPNNNHATHTIELSLGYVTSLSLKKIHWFLELQGDVTLLLFTIVKHR